MRPDQIEQTAAAARAATAALVLSLSGTATLIHIAAPTNSIQAAAVSILFSLAAAVITRSLLPGDA